MSKQHRLQPCRWYDPKGHTVANTRNSTSRKACLGCFNTLGILGVKNHWHQVLEGVHIVVELRLVIDQPEKSSENDISEHNAMSRNKVFMRHVCVFLASSLRGAIRHDPGNLGQMTERVGALHAAASHPTRAHDIHMHDIIGHRWCCGPGEPPYVF
jgi:hypothetical protein